MEFLSILKTENKNAKNYILAFFCWVMVSLLLGLFSGVIGAGLYSLIYIATTIRTQYEFLVYILPLCGVFTILIYKLFGVKNQNTNSVFNKVKGKNELSFKLLPAIFVSTVLTHIAGGSAGKEGAALQIGGSLSSGISKLLKLNEKAEKILIISGMAAVFSAVFGTPFTATVFAVTVLSVGKIYFSAILPSLLAALSSYFVARLLGVMPFLKATLHFSGFDLIDNLKLIFIMLATAIVGSFFVFAINWAKIYSKKLIKNDYNRILFGGVLIVALSFLFGSEYLGAGFELLNNVSTYETVNKEAFILKILFTAITIGVGFKGGEIVPALVVGATFAGALAGEISFNIVVAAHIAIVVMFATITKVPLAAIVLGIELFGPYALPYFIIAVIISMFLTGKKSLYSAQEYLIFRKKDKNNEKKTV